MAKLQYNVVAAATLNDLVEKVRAMVAIGWEPAGGIATSGSGKALVFMQAIIKDDRNA